METKLEAHEVSIEGLDRAEVLCALYAASHPQGMGLLHAKPGRLPIEEARAIIADGDARGYPYVDYLHGRVIKVGFRDHGKIAVHLFDRDCGDGAARAAIDGLRASKAGL